MNRSTSPDDPNLDHGYRPRPGVQELQARLDLGQHELDRRLPDGITSNAVCPGFVPATAARYTTGWLRFRLRSDRAAAAVRGDRGAGSGGRLVGARREPQLAGRGASWYLAGKAMAEPSPDACDRELSGLVLGTLAHKHGRLRAR